MDFKYIKKHKYDSAYLGRVESDRQYILIDYSDKYKYNQPRQIRETSYYDGNMFYDDDGVYKIDDDFDVLDDMFITNRLTREGRPLYFQHQLKYDVENPENIRVFDEIGNEIDKYIEYAYLDRATYDHWPISNNVQYDYDTLDSVTELGRLQDHLWAHVSKIESVGEYDNLPFPIRQAAVFGDDKTYVKYNESIIPDNGYIEFYFAYANIHSGAVNIAAAYDESWGIEVVNGDINGEITISEKRWYRMRVDFGAAPGTDNVTVISSDSFNASTEVAGITKSDFKLFPDDCLIFGLGIYEQGTPVIPWDDPLYLHRYSKSIAWRAERPASGPYRARILLPDEEHYIIKYDARQSGGDLYRNWEEWASPQPVWKKIYSSEAINEWSIEDGEVVFEDQAQADLERQVFEDIKIFTIPTEQDRVSVSMAGDKISVQNGSFRHDGYTTDHPLVYYHIPEYDKMPFESDLHRVLDPPHIKVKRRAEVLSSNVIKINPFSIHEGVFPDYEIPYNMDKLIENGDIVTVGSDVISYRSVRGINIYVNGTLLSNERIVSYDMSRGVIKLSRNLSIRDKVEVLYPEKVPGFVCPYPRLDRKTSDCNSYRLYLRASHPDYDFEMEGDVEEKLAYKKLVNGVEDDVLRSCLTNLEIGKDNGEYKPVAYPSAHLADVTTIEIIKIDPDRVTGGGLREDKHFGGTRDRIRKHPLSKSYLDIMNKHGLELPHNVVFIKIDSSLIDGIMEEFESSDEALKFIKVHIEKHLSAGTFYVIIDENHDLIGRDKNVDPYPNIVGGE